MSCPVCFGGDDLAIRESLNAGIGILLGVTAIVLGALARFIFQLAKRGRESFVEDTLQPTQATSESVLNK